MALSELKVIQNQDIKRKISVDSADFSYDIIDRRPEKNDPVTFKITKWTISNYKLLRSLLKSILTPARTRRICYALDV